MKLLIKFYESKASRIGILFPYAHTATKEYEKLIGLAESKPCHLKLEFRGQSIIITLRNESNGKTKIYPELEYDTSQIIQFQKIHAYLKEIQLVHVYYKNNILLVAGTQNMEGFINIHSVEIREPELDEY